MVVRKIINLIILFVWPCFPLCGLSLLTRPLYSRTFRNCLNNFNFKKVKNFFFPHAVNWNWDHLQKTFTTSFSWSYSLIYLSDEPIFRVLRWNSFINFIGLQFLTWRRKWQPTPVFLLRESRGQRSLVVCGP